MDLGGGQASITMGTIIKVTEMISGGQVTPSGQTPSNPFSLSDFKLAFTGGLAGFSFNVGAALISAGAALSITVLPQLVASSITSTVSVVEGVLAPVPAPALDKTTVLTLGNFATITAPFTTVSTPGFPFGIDVSGFVTAVS